MDAGLPAWRSAFLLERTKNGIASERYVPSRRTRYCVGRIAIVYSVYASWCSALVTR